MTVEILYMTEQLHRWLNRSVADHLAAQATRLARKKGTAMTTHQIASRKPGPDGAQVSGVDVGCSPADEAESIATIDAAEQAEIAPAIPRDASGSGRHPGSQMGMHDSEEPTVRA